MFFIKIAFSVLFLAFGINSAYAQEATNPCLTNEENEAFAFRVLQTKYMVSALSCNGILEDYNGFVAKYYDSFVKNGEVLRAYFKRCYGNRANFQLDKFITKIANHFSLLSIENHRSFCKTNHQSMLKFLKSDKKSLIDKNQIIIEDFIPQKCQ